MAANCHKNNREVNSMNQWKHPSIKVNFMRQDVQEAYHAIGGLSGTSKMPCYSYSIPASMCKTGSKLRLCKCSVCSKCYACKNQYLYPNVKNALQKRADSLNDLDAWKANFVKVIDAMEDSGFFRWHDAGDLQSMEHLDAIVEIALALPKIMFWLPTREYTLIKAFQASGKAFQENLIVRIASPMIDGKPNTTNLPTCTVSKNGPGYGFQCKAPEQNGECQDCRACWNQAIKNTNYRLH